MSMQDKLGVCQWFHYQDREAVHRTVATMRALGLTHLRTGVSWADFHRPEGEAWYDWQMNTLAEAGLKVLLSVWHTPPSIAEGGTCASPPRRLADYGDFIGQLIDTWPDGFEAVELWNEPNNLLKWDFERFDPNWEKFGEMVAGGAKAAKQRGRKTVLGGMMPVDASWLQLLDSHAALDDVDVIAIHGFPDMWWPDHPNWDWFTHWQGWAHKIEQIASVANGRPVWISETGLATWDVRRERPSRFDLQVRRLTLAAQAPAERVYWYCLFDLDPQRHAIEGFHVDENEYHLGLLTHAGEAKPAYERMRELLADEVEPVDVPESDVSSVRQPSQ
ncbi:hypothetical protein ACERK3_02845 [Phycisphaerales bacterium AB-hyl4]|uniref:Beta-xylosidase n=1 Tax=Natronomicrosphaera hydrolytica TaxID=3242702 RepID=A0ABV4U0U9_9BACT